MPPKNLLQWLATEYHGMHPFRSQNDISSMHDVDLNGSHVETLEAPPTPLEFSRMIHISRPVVIKGLKISALKKWTDNYLIDKMRDRKISVAITPNGLADAVTQGPDGRDYFVEPYVSQMTMTELLSRLGSRNRLLASEEPFETCYLQSQNGNLYTSTFFDGVHDSSELEPLRKDVPSEISWCSEALDRHPDAVNLWIGDGKNPYENIYTVIRGAKYFTLLPPTEGQYLVEKWYPHARYTRAPDARLQLTVSEDVPPVRWPSISDPHLPSVLPVEAHLIYVNLSPGETLYLPTGWWHHVRQADETTIALNWWYDTEMRGMTWVMLSFMRKFGSPAVEPESEEEL